MASGKATNAKKKSAKAERSKKDDDLSKPKVSTSNSPAITDVDRDSDSVLSGDGNGDEVWDIVRTIPNDESKVCRIDDCGGVAIATWASNLDPDDLWDYCASCQARDFPPETPNKEGAESNDDAPEDAPVVQTKLKTDHEEKIGNVTASNTDVCLTTKFNSPSKVAANSSESQKGENGSSPSKTEPTKDQHVETAVVSDESEEDTRNSNGMNNSNSSSDESSSTDEIVENGNLSDDSGKEPSLVKPSSNESSSSEYNMKETSSTLENGVDAEEEEIWTLTKVLPLSSLSRDASIKCSTDDCILAACSVWKSNLDPSNWYSCIDCQENDFDGWPNDELPITVLADDHKLIMAEKCSSQKDPAMPLLPSHDDGNKPSATKSPQSNTTNPEPTSSHTITPPPTNLLSQARKKHGDGIASLSSVTPSPALASNTAAASKAKTTKPSEKLLGLHRKWQAEAIAMGGPDVRIVVDKNQAKKIIFDLLHDAFRPFNITEIFKGLKAIVPSPVLKSCLDDMALDKAGDCFADTDDEDDADRKEKPKKKSSDPFEGSLCFKAGRNTNTSLYYVDHTKQNNSGNGLEADCRDKLLTDAAKADGEQTALQAELQNITSNTTKLLSEPTNEEAAKILEVEEKEIEAIRHQVEEGRKLKVNEKHKKQTKRRIDTMTSHWRKRKRICMDFLIMMEESTDGVVSMKKCLSGDGPIECDSDEVVAEGAIAYGVKKRSMPKRKMSRPKIVRKSSVESIPNGIVASEDFVAVKLSPKGDVIRIWIDEEGKVEEEAKREKKVTFC